MWQLVRHSSALDVFESTEELKHKQDKTSELEVNQRAYKVVSEFVKQGWMVKIEAKINVAQNLK